MKQRLRVPKCNFSITVPIDILEKLDDLTDRDNSRSKIVNEAITYWLKNVVNAL